MNGWWLPLVFVSFLWFHVWTKEITLEVSPGELQLNGTDETKAFWDVFWNKPAANSSSTCDERCGLPYHEAEEDDRIAGGAETKLNEFPWMVYLLIKSSTFFKQEKTSCGATLIKPQYLLTAAHCVFHAKVKSIDAFIGFHYLDLQRFEATGNEITVPVTKIMIHDEFDPETLANDIAVLQLYQPVKFSDQVHSICLPDGKIKRPANGAQMTIAGWGITLAFGTRFLPQMLLSTTVQVVENQMCRNNYAESAKYITKNSICAGNFEKDSCRGDSGGPLMMKTTNRKTTRYTQIGVVSFGSDCGTSNSPGVYAGVSSYIDWIQEVTSAKDPCKPSAPK